MAKKNLNIMPNSPEDGLPIVKRERYMAAMGKGDYHTVAQAIVQVLTFFDQTHYVEYGGSDQSRINEFVLTVFMVMTDTKFKPSKQDGYLLVGYSHVFAHIVASSVYQTTNPVLLQILSDGQDNFQRALFMCNSMCPINIDQKAFFDIDPHLASIWFNVYVMTNSNSTPVKQKNLLKIYQEMDERWEPPYPNISGVYFTVTYFAQEFARRCKGIMNNGIKSRINVDIVNKPNPKSIAIATSKWHRNHAVYKSASPLVNQLKGHYKTTFIHLGEHTPKDLMTEGFDQVCHVKFKDDKLILPPSVQNNDFQLVYYPDIGMSHESIWLSNLRLAPIQAVGYGHPDTTGDNNCIDYFIGGDCEKDCKDYYSEQMILLPGLAQAPAWPSYERKYNWVNEEPVKINCIWGPDKYNYCMLQGLAEISKQAKTDHVWHFYPSPAINRYAAFIPFHSEVKRILPNSVIHGDLHYAKYMEESEKGDFAVNSFPFGGYNTIVESFYLGLPVVTLEGHRFYNQAASHLLRTVGMPELTTTDPNKFVSKCVEMIDDKVVRSEYRKELTGMNLKHVLFENIGDDFKKAIDYIIANHPIKRGDPILIGELNG